MTFGGRESEKCKGIYQNNLKVKPLRFDTTEMSYCFKLFFFFASLFSSFEDTERFVMKKNQELLSKIKKKSIIVFFKINWNNFQPFLYELNTIPKHK